MLLTLPDGRQAAEPVCRQAGYAPSPLLRECKYISVFQIFKIISEKYSVNKMNPINKYGALLDL